MLQYFRKIFIYLLVLLLLPTTIVQAQSKKLDSLTQAIATADVDSLKVKLHIALSREWHRTPSHDTKDIDIASQAVDMALAHGDTIYYSRALNNLGLLYRFHQHYDIAIPLHIKAFELIEDTQCYLKDKTIYANNIGVAARYMADYETAVHYYLTALKIAEELDNPLSVEIASNGLGNTYLNLPGQEDLGVFYFEKALQTAENSNNKRGIAMNYLSLSSIYGYKKDYPKAREYLRKLAQINEEMGDKLGIGITHKAFGASYLNEGVQLQLAENHLNKAKILFETIGNTLQQAEVNYYMARLQYMLGNSSLAVELLHKGLEKAQSLKSKKLIISISKLLFDIYKENDQYKNALNYHMLWRDYQDSLNLDQQEVQVLALNKKFDLEKKEAEISSLKKEKQINGILLDAQKAKLKNRSLTLMLIAILFATLFIIFFQKHKNKEVQKKNTDIQAKFDKERITQAYERSILEAEVIAMQMKINPHFLFNSLNSIKLLIQQNENSKAINYLVHLARFNRSLLELENLAIHSLYDEIELAEQYLKLENKRFQNDFCYSFTYHNVSKEELHQYVFPPLLLQPYIENAIWHGLLLSDKKSKEIEVTITKREEYIEISIHDNGIGRRIKSLNGKGMEKGKGMGISKKRIALFNKTNNAKIDFKIIDNTDNLGEAIGTSVFLKIKAA